MSTVLEITQLTNGDVVLQDAEDEGEPLLRIRFSDEVRDMLGADVIGVAEAMIDAATDYLETEPAAADPTGPGSFATNDSTIEPKNDLTNEEAGLEDFVPPPVIH